MAETILVTGASRGIGRATALRLADDGFDVVVAYRRQSQAAEAVATAVRERGQNARVLGFDVADREATRKSLQDDVAAHGTYYGVIVNAGITDDAAFPMLTDEAWDQVLHTNLDGFYNVVKPLVMPMIQARQPGRIVAIGSVAGLVGNRGQVNYSAAKAGLIGAVKSLALELAKRRITVNCVAPGLIATDMTHDAEQMRTYIPQKRMGQPEEVAAAVSFFCSRDADYITRQVLAVDGGLT
ncbi:3-oxoacyl-ACP reductase FabG [Salinisphaera orenii]|uniref:3-oxoacyl-ACP reductase FabG n=1 Tax=Salinisphaera orenii TaxID=856731 RepID=UPI000DBE7072